MDQVKVSDYSIFSSACATTKEQITNFTNVSEAIDQTNTVISDESVFMGPIADGCKEKITEIKGTLTSFVEDFTKMTQFIIDVDNNYQQGDADAAKAILQTTEAEAAEAVGAAAVTEEAVAGADTDVGGLGGSGTTTSKLANGYSVVDTKSSLDNFYSSAVQGKGLYQKSGGYSDWCLGFACTHAYGMYSGNTNYQASKCNNSCEATTHFSRYKTDNKQDFMNKVYTELSNGRPVVMQVIGSKSKGTRHYVTAVGFKNGVTSASQLKDTDLLIVDSYDGKVEHVVSRGSSGDGRYIIQGRDTTNYKRGNNNYNYGYELYTLKA